MAVAAALLSAVVLWSAPESVSTRLHALTLDALGPACAAIQDARRHLERTQRGWQASETARLQAELTAAQNLLRDEAERTQRLTALLAEAETRPCAETPAAPSLSAEERLFMPALVEAAVMGSALSQAWRDGRMLDRGWKQGVRESALVLQGRGPLIDLGAAAQIAPEDPLLVGRTIVGKVTTVGRWTSMFLPVTDAEYRGRAQLVRNSERGPIWGAEGLLHGEGSRCRLHGIPVEEAVRVGDLVYSAERDGILSAALAYGRVVEAVASPDDREWTLIVEPAVAIDALGTVHVLRAALNPGRFWGN